MIKNQIAILIPVFNGLENTKKCLINLNKGLAVIDSKNVEFKIVVIDDGSTDGTPEWINDNFKQVVVLKGDGNLWWSGGINKGVEYVIQNQIANYTLWWNNDIYADKNYFNELIKLIDEFHERVIIGPIIYDLISGNVWSMGGMFNAKTGVYYMIGTKEINNNFFERIVEADWLPGMGTLLPVEVYHEVGYLDNKNFPQYHGDLDFTLRCRLNGYKIMVFPSLKIYNNTANSGFRRKENLKDIMLSLASLRSQYNIKRNIALYKKHTQTPFSYIQLFKKYFFFFGGFFKWKLLMVFGVKRK